MASAEHWPIAIAKASDGDIQRGHHGRLHSALLRMIICWDHSNLSEYTADELKTYQDTLDKLAKMKEQTALGKYGNRFGA